MHLPDPLPNPHFLLQKHQSQLVAPAQTPSCSPEPPSREPPSAPAQMQEREPKPGQAQPQEAEQSQGQEPPQERALAALPKGQWPVQARSAIPLFYPDLSGP
jgi:hypothetical protein